MLGYILNHLRHHHRHHSYRLRHLQQLGERVPRLQELVRDMHRRFDAGNQSGALDFLSGTVEPFLDGELLQFVYAYLHQAEEDLGDELLHPRRRVGRPDRANHLGLQDQAVSQVGR